MSTTPAAELARLRVQRPRWTITRVRGGFRAVTPGTVITAPTPASLEQELHAADSSGPVKRERR